MAILASCQLRKKQDERPNIIYVMVDDMGYGDLSSFGQTPYRTAQIDAFVKEGMKFNHAYAGAPVCTPTRVAFMTGRYPARNVIGLHEPLTGSPGDMQIGLSPSVPTVSSILKQNGYETALFGKWHLGVREEFSPLKHGFDHFFGILSGAADYVDHRPVDRSGPLLLKRSPSLLYDNETPVEMSGYLTDLITARATRLITRGKHDKPFFISLQYTSPHWPWQAPGDGPASDTIRFLESGSREVYAAMVKNLDENFGKVLEAVRAAGLEESTLIIFTSDNGGDRLSDMGPYKGLKLQLWEGGVRVPAAARWPGHITPGRESDQPIITMDWTATILDAARCAYADTLRFDGISLLPHFKNPGEIIPRKFYWRVSNRSRAEALRDGDWKYLRVPEGEFLFNLADDPFEKSDLAALMPEKLEELKTEFALMDAEMLAPVILQP